MKLRHVVVLALLPLVMVGCRKRPAPGTPGPQDSTLTTDGGGQARADSIQLAEQQRQERERLAEQGRLDRERRDREAATAPVREVLTEIVFFDYDSDAITPEAEQRLQLKAAILRANPGLRLRIEGHADQRGSTEYNLALGQRRAEAVRAYLADYGVDPGRFVTISYGKERPLLEGEGEDAWSRNRRAEFAVVGGEIVNVPQELRP
ncbi:MAG TPA: OmpA family protein [Longimicrobiaceae bacterium]|nr:OmpA family protein [Longimicrobiaceae bacterium]